MAKRSSFSRSFVIEGMSSALDGGNREVERASLKPPQGLDAKSLQYA
jgi:hypothetical protein